MSSPEVFVAPIVFEVCAIPTTYPDRWDWTLRVEARGRDRWAVVFRGQWTYCKSDARKKIPRGRIEPMNSSRTDAYLKAYRHTFDEAMDLAKTLAPKVMVMGMTAAEWMARVDARGEA